MAVNVRMNRPDSHPYPSYKASGIPWLGDVPSHWEAERGKRLLTKMERLVRDTDEVVTCFRDGTVTLRKNRRTEGFTESLKEIGYQGIRVGDLIVHAMDAFAGSVGVSDSDGKGTPVYSVCRPKPNANAHYYAVVVREMARNQWIAALATGIRVRSTDFRYSTLGTQLLPLPPPARTGRHRPVPGPRGPAHPAVRRRQAEAHSPAGEGEAGRRQPEPSREASTPTSASSPPASSGSATCRSIGRCGDSRLFAL